MELNKIFASALTYSEYREFVNSMVIAGKTTGNNQSEKLLEFTELNIQRMNRLDKTIQLPETLANLSEKADPSLKWLLIGDAWCGDCAQIIPIVSKIAVLAKVELRIISKDTFPELIEKYNSNGSKSIPKLLVFDEETEEVICSWGPRPKPAQDIMLKWKENKDKISHDDFEKELHLWYARDKGFNIINEITKLIEVCPEKVI